MIDLYDDDEFYVIVPKWHYNIFCVRWLHYNIFISMIQSEEDKRLVDQYKLTNIALRKQLVNLNN